MADLGSATLFLRTDDSELQRGLASAEQRVNQFAASLSNSVNQATTTAFATLTQNVTNLSTALRSVSQGGATTSLGNLSRNATTAATTIEKVANALQQVGSRPVTATINVNSSAVQQAQQALQRLSTTRVQVPLSANTQPIQQSFNQIPAMARSSGSRASGLFHQAFTIATGVLIRDTFRSIYSDISQLPSAIFNLPQTIEAATHALSDYNSTLQDYQATFAALLKGSDDLSVGMQRATQRLQELYTFARQTPFQIPEVIQADIILQNFGGTALASTENLTRFANAAMAVKAVVGSLPEALHETTFWFGRLYEGIQSGEPIGQALMYLQKYGLISGETATEVKKLRAEGASASAVWKVATQDLDKFNGMMEAMQHNWSTVTSNFEDYWNQRVVAPLTRPIFDRVLAEIENLTNVLNQPDVAAWAGMVGDTVGSAMDVAGQSVANFGSILGDLATWGYNVAAAFVDGFSSIVDGVVEVINEVVTIISDFLEGGSPTRKGPLSTIDQWFGKVISAYFGGWTHADFGVLDDLAGEVEKRLQDLTQQGLLSPQMYTVGADYARTYIAVAIDELKKYGEVGKQTIENIRSVAQDAADAIIQQLDAYKDIYAAQAMVDAQQKIVDAAEEAVQNDKDRQQVEQDVLDTLQRQYDVMKHQHDEQREALREQKDALQDQKSDLDDTIRHETRPVDRQLSDLERKKHALQLEIDKVNLAVHEADHGAIPGKGHAAENRAATDARKHAADSLKDQMQSIDEQINALRDQKQAIIDNHQEQKDALEDQSADLDSQIRHQEAAFKKQEQAAQQQLDAQKSRVDAAKDQTQADEKTLSLAKQKLDADKKILDAAKEHLQIIKDQLAEMEKLVANTREQEKLVADVAKREGADGAGKKAGGAGEHKAAGAGAHAAGAGAGAHKAAGAGAVKKPKEEKIPAGHGIPGHIDLPEHIPQVDAINKQIKDAREKLEGELKPWKDLGSKLGESFSKLGAGFSELKGKIEELMKLTPETFFSKLETAMSSPDANLRNLATGILGIKTAWEGALPYIYWLFGYDAPNDKTPKRKGREQDEGLGGEPGTMFMPGTYQTSAKNIHDWLTEHIYNPLGLGQTASDVGEYLNGTPESRKRTPLQRHNRGQLDTDQGGEYSVVPGQPGNWQEFIAKMIFGPEWNAQSPANLGKVKDDAGTMAQSTMKQVDASLRGYNQWASGQLSDLKKQLDDIGPAWKRFTDAIGKNAQGMVEDTKKWFSPLTTALDALRTSLPQVQQTVQSVLPATQTAFSVAFIAVGTLFDQLGTKLNQSVTDLGTWKDTSLASLGTFKDQSLDALGTFKDKGLEALGKFKDDALEKLGDLKDKGLEALGKFKDDALEKLGDLKDKGLEALGKFKDDALEKIGKLKDDALEKLGSLKDKAIEAFGKLKDDALDKLKSLYDDGTKKIGDLRDEVTKIAAQMVKNFVAAIQGALDPKTGVPAKIAAIVSAITEPLSHIDLLKLGSNMIQNLVTGIENKIPAVKGALETLRGLFPTSPAKWGPFQVLPDWLALLNNMNEVHPLALKMAKDTVNDLAQTYAMGMARITGLPMPAAPAAPEGQPFGLGQANTAIQRILMDMTMLSVDPKNRTGTRATDMARVQGDLAMIQAKFAALQGSAAAPSEADMHALQKQLADVQAIVDSLTGKPATPAPSGAGAGASAAPPSGSSTPLATGTDVKTASTTMGDAIVRAIQALDKDMLDELKVIASYLAPHETKKDDQGKAPDTGNGDKRTLQHHYADAFTMAMGLSENQLTTAGENHADLYAAGFKRKLAQHGIGEHLMNQIGEELYREQVRQPANPSTSAPAF